MIGRITVFFIFVGLFSLVFYAGSIIDVDPEEAQKLFDELEMLIADIDAPGIFIHNTSIALPMFIPGFGVGWGLFSAWSTGYAFAAITAITPDLDIPPLAILYLTPFGLMELSAYSLAVSRSYILIAAVFQKKSLLPHLRNTGIEIGVVVALLLAGGFVEFYMLESIQAGDSWLPPFDSG